MKDVLCSYGRARNFETPSCRTFVAPRALRRPIMAVTTGCSGQLRMDSLNTFLSGEKQTHSGFRQTTQSAFFLKAKREVRWIREMLLVYPQVHPDRFLKEIFGEEFTDMLVG
jgi:hypothetical protein